MLTKAETTSATVSASGWTYDGSTRRLVYAAGAVSGGTMQYSLDGMFYSDKVPAGTDAKTYTVWYKVAGDRNHLDSRPEKVVSTITSKVDPKPLGAIVPDARRLRCEEGGLRHEVALGTLAHRVYPLSST